MDFDHEGDDAYDISQATYGSEKHKSNLSTKGYIKDDELSSDKNLVYTKGDKVLIGYRGTSLKDASDLQADAALAFNVHNSDKSFKDAEDLYINARAKHKGKDVVLAGHSLGGSKSINVAKKHGVKKSYAFNPGTSIFGTSGGDTIVYNTKGDPVSSRLFSKNTRFVKGSSINPHGLDNYESHFKQRKPPVVKKKSIWSGLGF